MHQEREQGDLLDDAPAFEWEELKKLAENRDTWREMTRGLRDDNGVQIHMTTTSTHHMTTRRRHRAAEATPMTTIVPETSTVQQTSASKASEAKKYMDRDAHEAFFRPAAKQNQQKKKVTKSKKKKCEGLTSKQRAKESHTHWIIHQQSTRTPT